MNRRLLSYWVRLCKYSKFAHFNIKCMHFFRVFIWQSGNVCCCCRRACDHNGERFRRLWSKRLVCFIFGINYCNIASCVIIVFRKFVNVSSGYFNCNDSFSWLQLLTQYHTVCFTYSCTSRTARVMTASIFCSSIQHANKVEVIE